jgi:hypothetical protein
MQRCPAAPPRTLCGAVSSSGRLQTCSAGLVCACAAGDPGGACARRVPPSECESGLRYEADGYKQCATAAVVVAEHGLCPGLPEPATIGCGVLSASGRIGDCEGGESCVCAYDTGSASGACARSSESSAPCATGLETAHDGECVEFSTEAGNVVLGAGALRCPSRPPEETECGKDAAKECLGANSRGCLCDGPDPRCAIAEPRCISELALRGSLRCLPPGAEADLRMAGACPGIGDNGDAGADAAAVSAVNGGGAQ